jgi:hypothetical protein
MCRRPPGSIGSGRVLIRLVVVVEPVVELGVDAGDHRVELRRELLGGGRDVVAGAQLLELGQFAGPAVLQDGEHRQQHADDEHQHDSAVTDQPGPQTAHRRHANKGRRRCG